MAAIGPKDYTYYSKNCFCAKVSGSDKVIHLYPLAKSAYASDANFKSYFYVDDIFTWKDNESKNCVVGMCTENSDNYNHHAAARRSYMRINKGSTTYQVMNDGGLNTKPHCLFSGNRKPLAAYTNYIRILCDLYSAYFIQTDYFTITIYRTRSGSTTEIYSFPINLGTEQNPTGVLAAGSSLTQFSARYKGDIGGLQAGDIITLEISGHNTECDATGEPDYIQPTRSQSVTVLGAMQFIQVYRHSDLDNHTTGTTIPSNINPLNGTSYALLVSSDMYAAPASNTSSGGAFYRLFHDTTAGDPMSEQLQTSEILQGAQGTVESAYENGFSDLPVGYYYGVPTTWNGSTLVYVQVASNDKKDIRWYTNNYVSVNFNITMSITGTWDSTTQKYILTVSASVTGVRPTSAISLTSELHYSPARGTATRLATYSGSIPTNASSVVLTRTDATGNYTTDELGTFFTTANTVCAGATQITEGGYGTPMNPPL